MLFRSVNFINWQLHELEKLNVPVHMKTEVTAELLKGQKPDVVIAATGATPIIPKIPGVDRENVVTSHEVLEGEKNTGGKVIVIGGGCVGAETANHLASNLKEVTLVEILPDIATDEIVVPRWGLLAELDKNKVRVCTETTVKEIGEKTVILAGKINEEIPYDTVVLAVGSSSDDAFAKCLESDGYDVRIIGDAAKVGLVGAAITEGFLLGRDL